MPVPGLMPAETDLVSALSFRSSGSNRLAPSVPAPVRLAPEPSFPEPTPIPAASPSAAAAATSSARLSPEATAASASSPPSVWASRRASVLSLEGGIAKWI